jgi:hypothetical protein
MSDYPKVQAKFITMDNARWQWNVARGGGLAIFNRTDLPDGRISLELGDGHNMVVRPNDYVRAVRHVHGSWRPIDGVEQWVVPEIPLVAVTPRKPFEGIPEEMVKRLTDPNLAKEAMERVNQRLANLKKKEK